MGKVCHRFAIRPTPLVDIEFPSNNRRWRVPAIVVHTGADGMGVMFRNMQPNLLHDLRARTDYTPYQRSEDSISASPWPE